MNNEIAIYFQKIDLFNGLYLFRPIDIIKGTYNEQNGTFTTEANVECAPIYCGDPFSEDFFWYYTTIEKLKESQECDDTKDLLEDYFDTSLEYFYLGVFDSEIDGIKCLQIHYEQLLQEQTLADILHNEETGVSTFRFDKEYLLKLRNSQTLEEIQQILDTLLNISDELENKLQSKGKESSIQTDSNTVIATEIDEPIKEISSNQSVKKDIITLKELREEVLKQIIGQDNAVNDITRGIMINQTSNNPRNKSHILVMGPTGTGKTEIVKIICKTMGLPFFEADATSYTEEGYIGKSVYSMLQGLTNVAGDIKLAQNGILVIDEIDKKILSDNNNKFRLSVLYSLLKIMDRGIIELDTGLTGKTYFDTSNLTIIFMGAFEELYQNKIKDRRKPVGFQNGELLIPKRDIIISKDDLIKNGTPSEFLGRIGDITRTYYFTKKDLIKILNNSTISPLILQQQYFKEAFDVNLLYSEGYVNQIAEKALESQTNARELKSSVRESLKYAIDDYLSDQQAKTLKLTASTAKDPKKYYLS